MNRVMVAEGFALTDIQVLVKSEESGAKQTARTGPLPLICAELIRNTWLLIMTLVLHRKLE